MSCERFYWGDMRGGPLSTRGFPLLQAAGLFHSIPLAGKPLPVPPCLHITPIDVSPSHLQDPISSSSGLSRHLCCTGSLQSLSPSSDTFYKASLNHTGPYWSFCPLNSTAALISESLVLAFGIITKYFKHVCLVSQAGSPALPEVKAPLLLKALLDKYSILDGRECGHGGSLVEGSWEPPGWVPRSRRATAFGAHPPVLDTWPS